MTARDEILARLESSDVPMPERKARPRAFPNLVEEFAASLRDAEGEVFLAPDLDSAIEQAAGIFTELEADSVVAHREPPLSGIDLSQRFPGRQFHFPDDSGDYRAACASADAGFTSAEAALAATGSLVLVSSPTQARMTSLLPPVHLVLLPEPKILPSIFEWIEQRPAEFPANLVLVSGPSKTADIEQTLVVGVHGPGRLIVIVYSD